MVDTVVAPLRQNLGAVIVQRPVQIILEGKSHAPSARVQSDTVLLLLMHPVSSPRVWSDLPLLRTR